MSGFIRFDDAQNESFASIAASSSTMSRPVAIASDEKLMSPGVPTPGTALPGYFPVYAQPAPVQPFSPQEPKKKFSPVPLGLFSIASTTLLLSLINVQVRGITKPNILIGTYFAVGGLATFAAGLMDYALGDTLGCTAFCSYASFFLSLGILYWPSSNSVSVYSASELSSAFGILMIVWCIFSVFMTIASMRTSLGLASLLFTLSVTFLLLGLGHFLDENAFLLKAGGYTGIITSLIEYYVAASALFAAEDLPIRFLDPSLAKKTV